jgi:hypothetical protein
MAKHLTSSLAELAVEDRLRLDGLEHFVRDVMAATMEGLWRLIGAHLDGEAESQAGLCGCGRKRERRPTSVEVKLLGVTIFVPGTYFYCRHCHVGEAPVRRWLGVEHGTVSLLLERALTDLTERVTFGDAVDSLREQHGQDVDRTQAERITYRVGDEAEAYLAERREEAVEHLGRERRTAGVEQLVFTADGGAVPVGKLDRPPESACTEQTPRTPVRGLARGTRTIQGREARLCIVREAEKVTERTVDCHIAPYDKPEFSGERMLAAAAMAGMGDGTQIHGVFDMGRWIHTQFEEQFHAYAHSACADICHVTEYMCAAGRVLHGSEGAVRWGMEGKRRLLQGDVQGVLDELLQHRCTGSCDTDEHGKCLVRVARRYIENHRGYLDYPPIIERELPVGSGEAESGIRHLIKKRLDVAGAWSEENVKRMLALITVRASGLWDDFWRWRRERDVDAWRRRQRGELRRTFRGRPRPQRSAAVTPLRAQVSA